MPDIADDPPEPPSIFAMLSIPVLPPICPIILVIMSAPPDVDALFAMEPITMGSAIERADCTPFSSPPTDFAMDARLSPVPTCFIRSATIESILKNNR